MNRLLKAGLLVVLLISITYMSKMDFLLHASTKTSLSAPSLSEKIPVKIFQISVETVSDELIGGLKEADEVLHFKVELTTIAIFTAEGFEEESFTQLMESLNLREYKLLRTQNGIRNARLFNK